MSEPRSTVYSRVKSPWNWEIVMSTVLLMVEPVGGVIGSGKRRSGCCRAQRNSMTELSSSR